MEFYDKRGTPKAQAELWVESMQEDYGELPLVADFEGIQYAGGEIANYVVFLGRVKELIPGKEIIIYTGYYFWKDNSGYNSSYADYFKQFPLWIGAYETATPKIPTPWVTGDWLFWQFTEDGSPTTYGTEGKVDLNYFNGDETKFIERFGIVMPPKPETVGAVLVKKEVPYDGMERSEYEITYPTSGVTRYNVTKIERTKMDFFVSPYRGNNYVPVLIKKYNQDYGINGDGWTTDKKTRITTITGYAVSNGQPYGKQGIEGTISANELHMAFSFANWLVKDGIIPKIDKADDWRARTAIGWNEAQDIITVIIVNCKDYYEKEGATFKATAEIFIEQKCDFAVMLDGGGSTTEAIMQNGVPVLLNKSAGEETIAGYPYPMRPVAQLLAFKMKTGEIIQSDDPPIDTGEGETMNYKVLVGVKPRKTPSMYETVTKPNLVVGLEFSSSTTEVSSTNDANNGVTFVQMSDGYWVPLVYRGVEYVKALDTTTTPSTNPKIIKSEVYFDDGSVVTLKP